MKKYLIAILVLLTGFSITSHILKADESATGDVVIHFKAWDGDYENLGVHGWNGMPEVPEFDGEDDFGVFIKRTDIPITNEIGFIAVYYKSDGGEGMVQDWDRKLTEDVKIASNTLVADETTHIYIFEGAETKDDNPGYFVADNNAYNLLLVYADPSGSYEENIGVHNWGGWTKDADWGTPTKVFTNGASHTAINTIKVAMMHSENADAGLLIYAGEDSNKKTGDVNLEDALGEDPVLGDVGFAYVVSKGNGYGGDDNVYYDAQDFIDEAFTFSILPMGTDSSGAITGTYAPNPQQVFVELSAQVSNPYKEEVEVDEKKERKYTDSEAQALANGWFTILQGTTKVAIEEVQFAQNDNAVGTFVIILKTKLDNTKEYKIEFDLGLEDDNKAAELELDLDKEGPQITFIGPIDIIGKPAEERVINVEWGKKFDQNLFPTFRITDNRDGDLTRHFWIQKGESSTLDTSIEGDYTIKLKVEDNWGNMTEETFIFRVAKKAK